VTDGDHPLVGSWRLRRWTAISDDGSEAAPWGDDPEGLIVYSNDGTMSAMMGSPARPPFDSADLTGGSDEERSRAFATFIAYAGPFEVDGDVVRHHVEMSLFPNWVGSVQRRRWELDASGQRLTLTSPPVTVGGATRIQRLTWERVSAEGRSS
jgi:hypothetical protein